MGGPERQQRTRALTEPAFQAEHPPLPAPPDPSKDPGVVPSIQAPPEDDGAIPDKIDVFTLTPIAALKILCYSVEELVRITGEIPPTPPLHLVNTSDMKATGAQKKELAQSHSSDSRETARSNTSDNNTVSDHIDGVPFVKTPIGSPESHASDPLRIIGAGAQPIHIQHSAISRRFYSKKPPPISLEEYLLRLQKYCPMSTAVYLATSLYIYRLAVIEQALSVTPRNVHRLVLAGLRVAMKALEDLSYPHRRFSKVGGVSEIELGRLEIAFCFLMNFELRVNSEMLLKEANRIQERSGMMDSPLGFRPRLPPLRERVKDNNNRRSAPPIMQQVIPVRGFAMDVETQS